MKFCVLFWLIAVNILSIDGLNQKYSFKRFIEIELWRKPELSELYPVLSSIEISCRDINKLMRRVSTDNLCGLEGNSINIQGEDQQKLDIISNRVMKTSLCCSKSISVVVSEEEENPCLCSDVIDNIAFSNGEFAAVFDPIDGSSNIDSGLPTGTIFGIYRKQNYNIDDPLSSVLQKGKNLVVAGYCIYAATSHIVLTMGDGVHMFTLDDYTNKYYLTKSNIQIPKSGPIYSFNDVNKKQWLDIGIEYYLNDLKKGNYGFDTKPQQRYMGALVADTHNIIFNGGIFGYPSSISRPSGKLRLLYEANPISMIVEQAGGLAIDGKKRILEKKVEEIHERTPLFIGSKQQITSLKNYIEFFDYK
jgi:fructose-1,6-bisphosphatase I